MNTEDLVLLGIWAFIHILAIMISVGYAIKDQHRREAKYGGKKRW